MKKYFINFLLVFLLIVSVFTFGIFTPLNLVRAESISISQLIELLIAIGVIAPEKAETVRAAALILSQTATTSVASQSGTAVQTSTIVSTSTSYIQVLTPNGGESWPIDLDISHTITWGSSGLTQARVALISTTKSIGTCELGLLPVTSKNGNNEFKTLLKTAKCYNLTTGTSTSLKDGTYKVRVYYTDALGTTISDESNATFKITPKPIPSIKVIYPNGGETLIRNQEYDVKYRLTNVTNVKDNLIYLYLLDSSGNIAYNSHKIKRSDGTYSLDLSNSLSAGAYKIKFKTTTSDDNVELEDTCDNFFWISLP